MKCEKCQEVRKKSSSSASDSVFFSRIASEHFLKRSLMRRPNLTNSNCLLRSALNFYCFFLANHATKYSCKCSSLIFSFHWAPLAWLQGSEPHFNFSRAFALSSCYHHWKIPKYEQTRIEIQGWAYPRSRNFEERIKYHSYIVYREDNTWCRKWAKISYYLIRWYRCNFRQRRVLRQCSLHTISS